MTKASGFKPVSPEPEKMTDSCLNKLSNDLASLLMEEEDSDMTLVSNTGDHLPVHALLLKARSTFFRTLLSTRWQTGNYPMLKVGKEALTMIITFLYSGKLDKEEVAVEILFEVLQNARMMQITDLEEEVKTHIISHYVSGSTYKEAARVVNIINLGLENKFPEVVEPCLDLCQKILKDMGMISTLTDLLEVSKMKIRDLEIDCHQFRQMDAEKDQQIRDLGQSCDLLRTMDKANHQKIKDLERHIAHLESTRGPLDSSSDSCLAPDGATDRECLEPKMEEMPISNVFLTHELPAQGAAALPKRKD